MKILKLKSITAQLLVVLFLSTLPYISKAGNVTNKPNKTWKNSTIPYVIDNSFSAAKKDIIKKAAEHISEKTNLLVTLRSNEEDYVFIKVFENCGAGICGLSSDVGRSDREQTIELSSNLDFKTTVHEILHAAGLYHEHVRSDRDNYVTINEENIIPEYIEDNFAIEVNSKIVGAYDFHSIMHYQANAASRNGQPTITTIPAGEPIGLGFEMSAGDIAAVNHLYPIDSETVNSCQQSDRAALTAIYSALNGNNWPSSSQWNFTQPINTWPGVTLDANNCVYGLNLAGLDINGILAPEIGNLSEIKTINLLGNNITGSIPSSIGNLSKLKSLYLHNNQLTGNIPTEISNLTNLVSLSLRNNQLTGSIPTEIGDLVNLKSLSMTNNQLTGSIPSTIGNLTNLEYLHLSKNQLLGGIPSTIGNLKNLKELYLSNNQLTGSIPSNIGNLTNLVSLHLPVNQLTGSIPSTITSLSNLVSMNLYENQLTGAIPSNIGDLTKLVSLYFRNNQLSGNIPSTIGDLTNLNSLSLSNNQLTGSIPSTIGNLTNLNSLYLSNNQLSGSIPSTIAGLTNLNTLNLDNNRIVGSLPPWLADMAGFSYLTLQNNLLNGCYDTGLTRLCDQLVSWNSRNTYISSGNNFDENWENFCNTRAGNCNPQPSTCRQTDSLAMVAVYNALEGESWCPQCQGDFSQPMDTWYGLTLNTNGCVDKIFMLDASIGGKLAPEIGDLSETTRIEIGENFITGTIPSSMGNLKNLEYLSLGSNQLSGNIPTTIGNLENLEHLSLGNNQLTGNIPLAIGSLKNLAYLSLNFNQLSGSIPSTIGDLENLQYLHLRNNQIKGSLPGELADLNALSNLTLQNNQLNGCFEHSLSQLCDQLISWNNTNTYISNGNNFTSSWEQFCVSGGCGDKLASDNNINIKNYPNPFKGETTISYTLNDESKVSLIIYNAVGEQIDVLINNELIGEGKQTTIFNGSNYTAGIYYYSVQSEDSFDFQKMILLK